MRFARQTFEDAGDALVKASAACGEGWAWVEAKGNSRAFLAMRQMRPGKSHQQHQTLDDLEVLDAEDDPASLTVAAPGLLRWEYHILLSPVYQVPALYFRVLNPDGSPLEPKHVAELIDPLLHTYQSGPFPALSLDDHPYLAVIFTVLHPCGTEALLDTLPLHLSPGQVLLAWLSLQAPFLCLNIPSGLAMLLAPSATAL